MSRISRQVSEALRDHRDRQWLLRVDAGATVADLAAASGVSRRTVQLGVKRARDAAEELAKKPVSPPQPKTPWWLELVPLFPITSFVPKSKCPHHGPIRSGSVFCCMVCSGSGVDDHPALKRNPVTDPRPEPVAPKYKPKSSTKAKPETRRERRKKVA